MPFRAGGWTGWPIRSLLRYRVVLRKRREFDCERRSTDRLHFTVDGIWALLGIGVAGPPGDIASNLSRNSGGMRPGSVGSASQLLTGGGYSLEPGVRRLDADVDALCRRASRLRAEVCPYPGRWGRRRCPRGSGRRGSTPGSSPPRGGRPGAP